MRLATIQQQKGFSLSGLLVASFFLIMLAVLGMKLAPVYLEYSSINQIKMAFAKRAQIDNIKSITAQDIKVKKENGRVILSTQYVKQIPLVSNISLHIHFDATSD